ncbi:hypothetical protein ACRTC8_14965 [Vibrio cholerae]|uniref:hypothetical protein n=1 Tax=Vibrio cholerae TaxID=666 RepID=UPI003D7D21E8
MASEKNTVKEPDLLFLLILSFLFFISLSPALFGGFFSKLSLFFIFILNVCYFRFDFKIYVLLFLMTSYFIFKYSVLEYFIIGDWDFSPMVIYLNLMVFITIPHDSIKYFHMIRISVFYSILLGFLASLSSYFLGRDFFVHSLHNKGLIDINAFTGFTSIPQTFASLCLLYWMMTIGEKNVLSKLIGTIAMFSSINRTILGIFIFLSALKHKFYFLIFAIVLFFSASYVYIYVDEGFLTTQTLSSRTVMMNNVLTYILSLSFFELLLGSFKVPEFYIYESNVKYIENGFMYLIYYFGFVGFFGYIVLNVCFLYRMINLSFDYKWNFVFYCLSLTLIVQFMTHEFLFLSFYISVAFLIHKLVVVDSNCKSKKYMNMR